ncbi:hypothetical protein [Novacetimonas cocois]|nr:hypothetical protein [Novacetimonas cocois]
MKFAFIDRIRVKKSQTDRVNILIILYRCPMIRNIRALDGFNGQHIFDIVKRQERITMGGDDTVRDGEIALLEAHVGCLEVALQTALRMLTREQQIAMLDHENARIRERDEQQMAHQLGPDGDEFNDITSAHKLVADCIARVVSESRTS